MERDTEDADIDLTVEVKRSRLNFYYDFFRVLFSNLNRIEIIRDVNTRRILFNFVNLSLVHKVLISLFMVVNEGFKNTHPPL